MLIFSRIQRASRVNKQAARLDIEGRIAQDKILQLPEIVNVAQWFIAYLRFLAYSTEAGTRHVAEHLIRHADGGIKHGGITLRAFERLQAQPLRAFFDEADARRVNFERFQDTGAFHELRQGKGLPSGSGAHIENNVAAGRGYSFAQ